MKISNRSTALLHLVYFKWISKNCNKNLIGLMHWTLNPQIHTHSPKIKIGVIWNSCNQTLNVSILNRRNNKSNNLISKARLEEKRKHMKERPRKENWRKNKMGKGGLLCPWACEWSWDGVYQSRHRPWAFEQRLPFWYCLGFPSSNQSILGLGSLRRRLGLVWFGCVYGVWTAAQDSFIFVE